MGKRLVDVAITPRALESLSCDRDTKSPRQREEQVRCSVLPPHTAHRGRAGGKFRPLAPRQELLACALVSGGGLRHWIATASCLRVLGILHHSYP